jgi:hypothetical protein
MTTSDLIRTREALHAVAELVLAGPQYRASGTIKLQVSTDGFRTWAEPALAIVGTDLAANGVVMPISGRTARELADAVGVVAGAPADLYRDGSRAQVDDELVLDDAAAARIAVAFALGDMALRLLAPDVEPVLWPEHFDVAIRVDDINFGVSPGDALLDEPYAYVGVDPVPADDPYWNAPFGVVAPVTSFADPTALRDFFATARRRHIAARG